MTVTPGASPVDWVLLCGTSVLKYKNHFCPILFIILNFLGNYMFRELESFRTN